MAHARVTPRQPLSRMMRATRLREVRTPSARRRMNVFVAPYMFLTSPLTWDIKAGSSASRASWADVGRNAQA